MKKVIFKIKKSKVNLEENVKLIKSSISNIKNMSLNIKNIKPKNSFEEFQTNANKLIEKVNDYLKNPNESLKTKLINQINNSNNSLNNFTYALSENKKLFNDFNYDLNQYKNDNVSEEIKQTIKKNSQLTLLINKNINLVNLITMNLIYKKNKRKIFNSLDLITTLPPPPPPSVECIEAKKQVEIYEKSIETYNNSIEKDKKKLKKTKELYEEAKKDYEDFNQDLIELNNKDEYELDELLYKSTTCDIKTKELNEINKLIKSKYIKLIDLTLYEPENIKSITKVNNDINKLTKNQDELLTQIQLLVTELKGNTTRNLRIQEKLFFKHLIMLKYQDPFYKKYRANFKLHDKITEKMFKKYDLINDNELKLEVWKKKVAIECNKL